MQDVLSILSQIHRPKLLMRAARIGAQDYCRDRHLARILGVTRAPRSSEALLRLIELEESQNANRVAATGNYNMARHIELLIALVGESRVLQNKGAAIAAAPQSTVLNFPLR